MRNTKYKTLHAKYSFPEHADSNCCSNFDMVRVLDLAVPVCLQRTSWSVAAERLEVSRDPPAKWLNATY